MSSLQPLSAIRILPVLLCALVGLSSCGGPDEQEATAPPPREDELFRVGSLAVYEQDLALRLKDRFSGRTDPATREIALAELVQRAQFAQAALDAGLAEDSVLREEVSRLLEARLRETELAPLLKQQQPIPKERLRELYEAQLDRFQASEKRQVAALWLDSGPDPERAKRYAERMNKAREFAQKSPDILEHPAKGFSVLGADYSEHSASRFRGGVVGWMEAAGGLDTWSKAVAQIAFSLKEKGEISEVVARPEGVFLVRLMDLKPAVTRPFEAVAAELERAERTRLLKEIEEQFKRTIADKYPAVWPADK